MDQDAENMKIRKIERGMVVDHLPAGSALKVLSTLGVDAAFPGTLSVLMNVPSSRYGLKDLIKLEGKEFSRKELEKVSLLAPYASVNLVRDYKVVEKYRLSIPDEIRDAINCPNPRCITNSEGTSRFTVECKQPLKIRCAYCETEYREKEVAQAIPAPLAKWI
jgi:aspartate carbamoyltransferase regulatory subunit